MQTIQPSPKQLFCRKLKAETKTKTGILLSSSTISNSYSGEVINIGEEVQSYNSKDKIIYKPYGTVEIKLNGEEYFLIAEDDVLGKVLDV